MTSQEERARAVLAEHAEQYGYPLAAASIRKGDDPWFYTVCARAMLALAAEVREDAAKVADEQARRIGEAEELLTMLVCYDDEASPRGLMDAVDNNRQPYQSAAMAGLVSHARGWLPGNSAADRCALYRAELAAAGLPASSAAPLPAAIRARGGVRG